MCYCETGNIKRQAFVLPPHTLNQFYQRQLSESQTKQTAEHSRTMELPELADLTWQCASAAIIGI